MLTNYFLELERGWYRCAIMIQEWFWTDTPNTFSALPNLPIGQFRNRWHLCPFDLSCWVGINQDRWEVGPYFAHHLASCTPLHPYVTLHFEMLLFHFLPTWTLKSHIPSVGSPDSVQRMCKKSAHFQKCRCSRKEGHSKCCTSSALPDDMGMQ